MTVREIVLAAAIASSLVSWSCPSLAGETTDAGAPARETREADSPDTNPSR